MKSRYWSDTLQYLLLLRRSKGKRGHLTKLVKIRYVSYRQDKPQHELAFFDQNIYLFIYRNVFEADFEP